MHSNKYTISDVMNAKISHTHTHKVELTWCDILGYYWIFESFANKYPQKYACYISSHSLANYGKIEFYTCIGFGLKIREYTQVLLK